MSKVVFRVVNHGSDEWKEAVKLREDVLRRPLGSCFSEEELSLEKDHFHISGYIDKDLVVTAVLVPKGDCFKMQRVAVKEELRSTGIGAQLLLFCEDFSRLKQVNTIYCHARDSAVNFYARNGYHGLGEYFDEDGIPHLKMKKTFH